MDGVDGWWVEDEGEEGLWGGGGRAMGRSRG